MPKFHVDEDLAALIEKLAKPKPFENLTFNKALRKVVQAISETADRPDIKDLDQLLSESMALATKEPKKAPSPSALQWAAQIPELKNQSGLTTWKALCDHLDIETAGDSARRRLKNWVKEHKPHWPEVPSIPGT